MLRRLGFALCLLSPVCAATAVAQDAPASQPILPPADCPANSVCTVTSHPSTAYDPKPLPNEIPAVCPGLGLIPIIPTHRIPPYPMAALRANKQGTVFLRAEIAPDGSVFADTLDKSSGYNDLDNAALEYVKKNWRWQPYDCPQHPASHVLIDFHLG